LRRAHPGTKNIKKSEEKLQPSRGEDNRVEEIQQLCKLSANQLKGYCMSTGMPLVCELETAAEHLQRRLRPLLSAPVVDYSVTFPPGMMSDLSATDNPWTHPMNPKRQTISISQPRI